jgi:hypothetical protein
MTRLGLPTKEDILAALKFNTEALSKIQLEFATMTRAQGKGPVDVVTF